MSYYFEASSNFHAIIKTCHKSPFREMNVVHIVEVGNNASVGMMNKIESGISATTLTL